MYWYDHILPRFIVGLGTSALTFPFLDWRIRNIFKHLLAQKKWLKYQFGNVKKFIYAFSNLVFSVYWLGMLFWVWWFRESMWSCCLCWLDSRPSRCSGLGLVTAGYSQLGRIRMAWTSGLDDSKLLLIISIWLDHNVEGQNLIIRWSGRGQQVY